MADKVNQAAGFVVLPGVPQGEQVKIEQTGGSTYGSGSGKHSSYYFSISTLL
jgi:predicted RNA-binding protein with TRAM domain